MSNSIPPSPAGVPGTGRWRLVLLVLVLLVGAAGAMWMWRDRLQEPPEGPQPAEPAAAAPAGPSVPLSQSVSGLSSGEAVSRAAAARELGPGIAAAVRAAAPVAESQAAVDALVAAVADPDDAVGIAAGTSLAVAFRARPGDAKGGDSPLDPAGAVAALGRRIGSESPEVRTATLAALSGIARSTAASAPPELLALLESGSPEDRDQAAQIVATFSRGIDAAIPVMFQAFENGQPGQPGIMNAAMIVARPSPGAVPLLIEKLGHERVDVRAHAARMLGRIGPEARDALPALLTLLANSDPRGIEGLNVPKDFRGYSPNHDPAAETAAQAVGKIVAGTDAAPAIAAELASAMQAGPPSHRRVYAYTLGLCGAAAAPAVPALLETLRAEIAQPSVPETGPRLVWALGEIAPGTPQAAAAIAALDAALDATDPAMVIAAANTLGRFGAEAAGSLPKLEKLAENEQYGRALGRVIDRLKAGP